MPAAKKKTASKTGPTVEVDGCPVGGYAGLKATNVPADAELVVEVVYPVRTITYEHGSDHDGTLDFRFPVIAEGDVLVRLLDGVDPETRTLIGTGTFTATA